MDAIVCMPGTAAACAHGRPALSRMGVEGHRLHPSPHAVLEVGAGTPVSGHASALLFSSVPTGSTGKGKEAEQRGFRLERALI